MTLRERLAEDVVICAEGYLFELERRGYVQAGPFVPEVVLEAPEAVAALHREFAAAGSDVVEAFTYYGHRAKLRAVGREDDLERLNRAALRIAADVAAESGALLAGNISNTHSFEPDDGATHDACRAMFEEQVGWAADAGVDFVIAETFPFCREAEIAVETIRRAGLECVATLAVFRDPVTFDGVDVVEACRRLAAAGADVVGLNCMRGPQTMLGLLAPIVAAIDVPVAALPVPYRTTAQTPAFVSLCDAGYPSPPGGRAFPTALDPLLCNRYEIADFTRAPSRSGSATSASAVAPAPTTSARWPRRSAAGRPRAATRRRWRATRCSEPTAAPPTSAHAMSSGSDAADVAVVGAGVVGLACAHAIERARDRRHRARRRRASAAAPRAATPAGSCPACRCRSPRPGCSRPGCVGARSPRRARHPAFARHARGCAGCGSSAATAAPSASAAACSRWSRSTARRSPVRRLRAPRGSSSRATRPGC